MTLRGVAAAGVWLAAATAMAQAPPPGLLDFDAGEVAKILRHGPWPPAPVRDPGNAAAGNPQAIALGEALFFDARLSAGGRVACASCHRPELAFADALPRSIGLEPVERNSPSLWNAVHERWYGWDGAADALWAQSVRPLLDPREMGTSAAAVATVIATDPDLASCYRRTFGSAPAGGAKTMPEAVSGSTGAASVHDAETTFVNVAKAIAAFVATLVSGRTPFDDFRDALASGDRLAAARYPVPAQRGLRTFVGRGQCNLCHHGPLFTNGEFADIGVPFFVRPGVVDPGRHGGILALRASRYNLLTNWSDEPAGAAAAIKTRSVQLQHRNFGEFKVPSLRNVGETAPYMHDGQISTLGGVIRHYSELDPDRLHADGEQILRPLALTALESADLEAFLRSLSDPGARNWKRAPSTPPGPPAGAAPGGRSERSSDGLSDRPSDRPSDRSDGRRMGAPSNGLAVRPAIGPSRPPASELSFRLATALPQESPADCKRSAACRICDNPSRAAH